MKDCFCRTEYLLGSEGMEILRNSHVAIFGVGGVGGFACEAIVRAGVGKVSIIDYDDVDISNINRQIIADTSTVGRRKVEVMKERLLKINPELEIFCFDDKYMPDNRIGLDGVDFVVDAIDIVTAKIDLIEQCVKRDIRIISSMGMGNKLDPSCIKLADLSKTSVCPLARVMRRELSKRGIKHLMTVFSTEEAITPKVSVSENGKRQVPGSCSFVPSVAGLFMAGYVVRNLAVDKVLG